MSKAFVKDDATPEEDKDLNYDPVVDEMGEQTKNYITPHGLIRLKAELEELVPTPDSERRIRLLHKRIDNALVIDPETQKGDQVIFGATVTVLNSDSIKRVYKIVGVDETDFTRGKISWISPIAKALLQARVGDFVTLETPQGDDELEIQKIEFKKID